MREKIDFRNKVIFNNSFEVDFVTKIQTLHHSITVESDRISCKLLEDDMNLRYKVKSYKPLILGNKNIAKQRATNKDARREPDNFGSPPIKKNIESVELNIQTLINQANDMGIDKIVFPSFDMIAARRFQGDKLKAAIDNKSIKKDAQGDLVYNEDGSPVLTEGNALYKNYVTDFR